MARYPLAELALFMRGRGGHGRRLGRPRQLAGRGRAEEFTGTGLGELAARCTAITSPPAGRWAGLGITSREAEVLGLVTDGLANKQIAERLALSVRTVEKHMESLLRKTGARSRTELAVTSRHPAT